MYIQGFSYCFKKLRSVYPYRKSSRYPFMMHACPKWSFQNVDIKRKIYYPVNSLCYRVTEYE